MADQFEVPTELEFQISRTGHRNQAKFAGLDPDEPKLARFIDQMARVAAQQAANERKLRRLLDKAAGCTLGG